MNGPAIRAITIEDEDEVKLKVVIASDSEASDELYTLQSQSPTDLDVYSQTRTLSYSMTYLDKAILKKPTVFSDIAPSDKKRMSLRLGTTQDDGMNEVNETTSFGKMVRMVKDKDMADLLEAEPKVAQELAEIIQSTTIKEINDKLKRISEKKKYKSYG